MSSAGARTVTLALALWLRRRRRGTAEAPVWTMASRIMAYTHFEFVHVSGTAQQGLFFLRLGE